MRARWGRIRTAILVAAVVVAAAPDAWRWPVDQVVVTREYQAPPHPYGAGHRGIDLRVADGDMLRTPADGVVAFAGQVAGRAVVTIDHGGGLVTTLEPAVTDVDVGTPVARGDEVAEPSIGGHAATGDVHFGVRRDGEYLNPRMLLGGVPRAVLLPCC